MYQGSPDTRFHAVNREEDMKPRKNLAPEPEKTRLLRDLECEYRYPRFGIGARCVRQARRFIIGPAFASIIIILAGRNSAMCSSLFRIMVLRFSRRAAQRPAM